MKLDLAKTEEAAVDPHAETRPSDSSTGETPELVGRRLGHFRIDAVLGRGGMGAVYRAWDTSLERDVALKVVIGVSLAAQERFLREARVQAKLRHPNVVPIHFVGEAEGVTFLVMDLVTGEALSDTLARQGVLDESRVLDVADAIAAALSAGQEAGLVHRDVKPSNILVDQEGRVLLADFGLAKTWDSKPISGAVPTSESAVMTAAGAILGTPAYMAPEQARGEAVDFRADMYSLGVTLYECLTGQPPFTAPSAHELMQQHVREPPLPPRSLAPNVRPVVDALVLRMMEKKPDARFATYADLRASIAAARAKPVTQAPIVARAVAFLIDLIPSAIVAGLAGALAHSVTVGWVGAIVGFAFLEHAWSTVGKRLLHLRVVDLHGDKAALRPLVIRSLARMAGPIVWCLDTDVLGGLLHAPRASTAVSTLAGLVWVVGLAFAFGKAGTFHDRLARTREVYAV